MIAVNLKRLLLPRLPVNREYRNITLWLLVFLYSPRLMRGIDLSAAPIDAGALSAIVMAVLALLVFLAVTWWIIRVIWPMLAQYSEHSFEINFNSLLPWQKIVIYLVFYLSLLFAFVFTLSAVMG